MRARSVAVLLCCALTRTLTAQAPGAAVQNALLAQVEGPGGCLELDSIVRISVSFFPEVRFWKGTCSLEHGAEAHPVAATDAAGLIYVLDSESSFAFLLRQHRPVGIDSAQALPYARLALSLQGKVPWDARLVTSRRDVPAELCGKTGLSCDGLTVAHAEQGGRDVYLTAFTEEAAYTTGLIRLDLETGDVVAVIHEWYAGGHAIR